MKTVDQKELFPDMETTGNGTSLVFRNRVQSMCSDDPYLDAAINGDYQPVVSPATPDGGDVRKRK